MIVQKLKVWKGRIHNRIAVRTGGIGNVELEDNTKPIQTLYVLIRCAFVKIG